MSLQKEFEVTIDGKDYTLEMDNMGYLLFERLVGQSPVSWAIETSTVRGQPKRDDMLKLLMVALRKHHPKLKTTIEKLSEKVSISALFINLEGRGESLGDKLIEALRATFADEDDLNNGDGEPDPLDGKPPGGGI